MSTSYCGITARKNAWPCENNVLKLPRNWQMFWRKSTRISRTCINIFVERMVKQFSTWFSVLCEELWTSHRIHCDLHYSSTPYSASVNYKLLYDFSNDWMELFKQSFAKFGTDFTTLVNIQGPRPPVLKKSTTDIPSEVAFRICAIRETFEESGILLLKNLSSKHQSRLSFDEVQIWRKKVYADASNFLNMCRYWQDLLKYY